MVRSLVIITEVHYLGSHFRTTYRHGIFNSQSDYLTGEARIVAKRIVSDEGVLMNLEAYLGTRNVCTIGLPFDPVSSSWQTRNVTT
jgi:hypothetical protein